MIGKGKSISHGGQAIDYALNKENAQVIEKNGVYGLNGTEIKQEFEVFQNLNSRATNKDLSFVLSPEPKDGKKLTNSEWKEIANEFMKGMKLKEHQYIAIKHTDREHTHLHIIANRINENGICHNDAHITFRAREQAERIANERGLTLASNVEISRKTELKQAREELKQIHENVMKQRPRTFGEYMERMKANHVEIKPTVNKQGKVQGFRLEHYGQSFKASELGKAVRIKNMIGITNPTSLALKSAKMIVKTIDKGIKLSM